MYCFRVHLVDSGIALLPYWICEFCLNKKNQFQFITISLQLAAPEKRKLGYLSRIESKLFPYPSETLQDRTLPPSLPPSLRILRTFLAAIEPIFGYLSYWSTVARHSYAQTSVKAFSATIFEFKGREHAVTEVT